MKFETIKELIIKLMQFTKDQDAYVAKLPSDIGAFIFDNDYANNQGLMIDTLMRNLLGEELSNDICWLMYDWVPGFTINTSNTKYTINTLDDYFKYLEAEYTWN